MIRWKFQRLKSLDFLLKENYKNKSVLGLLVHLDDKSFTKQTLNLNFIFDPLSKDKFLLSVSKPLSRCGECVPLTTTPILMVECYWNPWRTKLYMSQGLPDYSHVLQPLSKFTCSNIKAPLSLYELIFEMMN